MRTAAELIREDLSSQLTHLFIVFGMHGIAMVRPIDHMPKTYEEYVRRHYGDRPADHFALLNYGLLASIITLIVAVAWAIQSG